MFYQELQPSWREYKDQGDIKRAKMWICEEISANIRHIETVFGYPFRVWVDSDCSFEKKLFKPEFDMICETVSEFSNSISLFYRSDEYPIEDLEGLRMQLIVLLTTCIPQLCDELAHHR